MYNVFISSEIYGGSKDLDCIERPNMVTQVTKGYAIKMVTSSTESLVAFNNKMQCVVFLMQIKNELWKVLLLFIQQCDHCLH